MCMQFKFFCVTRSAAAMGSRGVDCTSSAHPAHSRAPAHSEPEEPSFPKHGDRRKQVVRGTRIKGKVLYQPPIPLGPYSLSLNVLEPPLARVQNAGLPPPAALGLTDHEVWPSRTSLERTLGRAHTRGDSSRSHRAQTLQDSRWHSRGHSASASPLSAMPFYFYSPAGDVVPPPSPSLPSFAEPRRRVRAPSASVLRPRLGTCEPPGWSPLPTCDSVPTLTGAKLLRVSVSRGEAVEQPVRPLLGLGVGVGRDA